jgi:cell division transport system permease protein
MKVWLAHHLHSLKIALERLQASRVASLLSVLVIGVALSLPASLYVLLANASRAAGNLATQPEISVFLKTDVAADQAQQLAADLGRRDNLSEARFVHHDQAMRQMQQAGLGDVMAGLSANPLPHAITLRPANASPADIEKLAAELRGHQLVQQVSLDADWSRRLTAILSFGQELVWLLAIALGIALVAITGNTIRLQIYAQREEIEVSRLIGATDRFIRRPFLYFGGLQGLFGGLAAWGLSALALALLQGSVSRLAVAYGSHFALSGLGLIDVAALLAASGLLGLLGAWVAVIHTQRSLDIP